MTITNQTQIRLPSAIDTARNAEEVAAPKAPVSVPETEGADALPEPIIGVPNSHHPVDLTDFIQTAAGGPVQGATAPWATRVGGTVTVREAVDTANASIRQVQRRMTEELRSEDHISNLSANADGSVAVVLSPHASFGDAAYINTARMHLAEAGLADAEFEIVRPAIEPVPPQVGAQAAVAAVNSKLAEIHNRLTEELRVEDAITKVSLNDDGSVSVTTNDQYPFGDDVLTAVAQSMLSEAGYDAPSISVDHVPTPGTPAAAVADALDAIRTIQGRMTEELRAEDGIVNVVLKDADTVTIVLGPHVSQSDSVMMDVVGEHMNNAGWEPLEYEVVRPAVDPFVGFHPINGPEDIIL